MYGYNSVGMRNDGSIMVEIEENTPMNAIFSKDTFQVGNLVLPNASKNKEIVIRVVIKD